MTICTLIYLWYLFKKTGYLLFKQYCDEISPEPVPQLAFYEEVN